MSNEQIEETTAPELQLTGYYQLTGEIFCDTGLHVGAGSDTIEIGGTDRPVIKHPFKNYPYIPGSSLKGKLRSLLELRYGAFDGEGDPYKRQDGAKGFIGRIFGIGAGDKAQLPTALIVRDAVPTENYLEELGVLREQGREPFEQKSENTVNRITSKANPRVIERVPEGAIFKFEATYRIFARDGDDAEAIADFRHVLEAMALLELDTLGGHGSRGYGRIHFKHLQYDDMMSKSDAIEVNGLTQYLTPS